MSDRTADALEAALRANPDDLAGWSAYADYLAEQGDPRGEFVRVQLELEHPDLDKDRRKRLHKLDETLLDDYGREWVGRTLGKALLGTQESGLSRDDRVAFRRGAFAEVRNVTLTAASVKALASARTARMLTTLDVTTPRGPLDLAPLAKGAFRRSLRRLVVTEGFLWNNPHDRRLAPVVAALERLESLAVAGDPHRLADVLAVPMPRLTELAVTDVTEFPTSAVAHNPTLTGLRHLAVRPPFSGNIFYLHLADLRAVCRSPYLAGLRSLSFQQCDAGNAGLDELIDSGLAFQLERLDLTSGWVTGDGVGRLADALGSRPHALKEVVLSSNAVTLGESGRLVALGVRVSLVEPELRGRLNLDDVEPDPDYDDHYGETME